MIFKEIKYDIEAVMQRDPAARNFLEVLLLYQGVHALIFHRFAHRLYRKKHFFTARLISQISRFITHIEIHPGAKIGRGILIDHGAGVVIGETAVVGAGAKILGSFEVGDNCKIAANAVLLKPLANDITVAGVPAKPVKIAGVAVEKKGVQCDLFNMEDNIEDLQRRVALLEGMEKKLKRNSKALFNKQRQRQLKFLRK